MSTIVLDANAVIMHGRAFSDRVRGRAGGDDVVLPASVKRELVDDVLATEAAPANHQESAREIEACIRDGHIDVRSPDFETFGPLIDEARRRIADESLPEHAVKADQYIPAIVCELAEAGPVRLVTADKKLRGVVTEFATRRELDDVVEISDPLTVL